MLRFFSPGVWIVVLAAIGSAIAVSLYPKRSEDGISYWLFDRNHAAISQIVAREWNQEHPEAPVRIQLLAGAALQSRMMSGFYADTPVGDMIEVERSQIGKVFAGPLEDIGFVDLTPRLEAEGLRDKINAPSFSPWTSRGHIFGLPHDVHPIVLMYRSDLVEAAGIDVSKIETWDDYFRVMRPLQQDLDGDGRIDRYLLNSSPSSLLFNEVLLFQAGGGFFDADGRPALDSEINVKTLAKVTTWYVGPDQVANEVNLFSAAGVRLIADGYVVGLLAPDFLLGSIPANLPSLAGKLKVMPIPAFTNGGRRTSVLGGTMLGITRASKYREQSWEFAKRLYLSPATAHRLYDLSHIITPIKSNWNEPFYDEPDPYYSNQHVGRVLISLAPSVPRRPSSPFYTQAQQAMNQAEIVIARYAEENRIYDAAALEPAVRKILGEAQARLLLQMDHNVFLARK